MKNSNGSFPQFRTPLLVIRRRHHPHSKKRNPKNLKMHFLRSSAVAVSLCLYKHCIHEPSLCSLTPWPHWLQLLPLNDRLYVNN